MAEHAPSNTPPPEPYAVDDFDFDDFLIPADGHAQTSAPQQDYGVAEGCWSSAKAAAHMRYAREMPDSKVADVPRSLPAEPEPMPPALRSESRDGPKAGNPESCWEAVLSCFPDICPDYVMPLAAEYQWDSARLVSYILDEQENGRPYPKKQKPAKRKRPDEDDGERRKKGFETQTSAHVGKTREYVRSYTRAAHALLRESYPQLYAQDVARLLAENHDRIYPTVLALHDLCTNTAAGRGGIRFKKAVARRPGRTAMYANSTDEAVKDALAEFEAANAACQAKASKEADERRREKEEAENLERARAEGAVSDCGCCFDEFPLNRMVHCDGEVAHWFCRECARRMAENAVGLSKYQLECMSMDGCQGTFRKDQRDLFLDDKLALALDKIEQEAVIRMAGIENLETCPFCPYAAEYPPVEENKEFRCLGPDCGVVSCRRCRRETHVPKTCEEVAREAGLSARRKIEEAMSDALIRKCNKCGTPFIKENGCNKMTCTRSGCRNVQCYVCSKSCDYSHFDDSSRGGKKGNCPLFDDVEKRHEQEVKAAEEEARKRVTEDVPGVDADLLKIEFSENVKKDEERRKTASAMRAPRPVRRPHPGAIPAPPLVMIGQAGQAPVPPNQQVAVAQQARQAQILRQAQQAQQAQRVQPGQASAAPHEAVQAAQRAGQTAAAAAAVGPGRLRIARNAQPQQARSPAATAANAQEIQEARAKAQQARDHNRQRWIQAAAQASRATLGHINAQPQAIPVAWPPGLPGPVNVVAVTAPQAAGTRAAAANANANANHNASVHGNAAANPPANLMRVTQAPQPHWAFVALSPLATHPPGCPVVSLGAPVAAAAAAPPAASVAFPAPAVATAPGAATATGTRTGTGITASGARFGAGARAAARAGQPTGGGGVGPAADQAPLAFAKYTVGFAPAFPFPGLGRPQPPPPGGAA